MRMTCVINFKDKIVGTRKISIGFSVMLTKGRKRFWKSLQLRKMLVVSVPGWFTKNFVSKAFAVPDLP